MRDETSVTVPGRGRHQVDEMSDPEGTTLPEFDPASIVDLDVRPEIAAGREPLPQILAAAGQLPAGAVLHLRSPFRPTPLFARLEQLGFASQSISFADDDWSTWFWRPDTAPRTTRSLAEAATPAPEGVHDLRLLPPPEPLLWILGEVEASDAPFDVLLPFYPEPLVALLEPSRRRIVLVENRPDGVQVRIEAPNG